MSQPSAEGIVVRPSPARLLRALAVAAPGMALGVYGILTEDADAVGPWALPAAVVILVLCAVTVGVFYTLLFRNERLYGRGRDLVHVDWRGRSRVVPRAEISGVGLVTVATAGGPKDERVIIAMSSGAPPFVIRVGMWDTGHLHDLLQTLGIGVHVVDRSMKPGELLAHFPGMRLRYPERHPWLFGLAATAAIAVVIAGVIGVAGAS